MIINYIQNIIIQGFLLKFCKTVNAFEIYKDLNTYKSKKKRFCPSALNDT